MDIEIWLENFDSIEILADAIIVLGAVWIAWLFLKTYKHTKTTNSLVLGITFGLFAAYFALQIILVNFINKTKYAWMESHEVFEIILLFMIVSFDIVLTMGPSWRGKQLRRGNAPRAKEEDKKAA